MAHLPLFSHNDGLFEDDDWIPSSATVISGPSVAHTQGTSAMAATTTNPGQATMSSSDDDCDFECDCDELPNDFPEYIPCADANLCLQNLTVIDLIRANSGTNLGVFPEPEVQAVKDCPHHSLYQVFLLDGKKILRVHLEMLKNLPKLYQKFIKPDGSFKNEYPMFEGIRATKMAVIAAYRMGESEFDHDHYSAVDYIDALLVVEKWGGANWISVMIGKKFQDYIYSHIHHAGCKVVPSYKQESLLEIIVNCYVRYLKLDVANRPFPTWGFASWAIQRIHRDYLAEQLPNLPASFVRDVAWYNLEYSHHPREGVRLPFVFWEY